jgi:hypothetical protein
MHRPSISYRSGIDFRRMSQIAQLAQAAQSSQTAPVPPQNLDAEESVLGAMMLSPGAIGAVSEVLDAGELLRDARGLCRPSARRGCHPVTRSPKHQ